MFINYYAKANVEIDSMGNDVSYVLTMNTYLYDRLVGYYLFIFSEHILIYY